jgi:hypothetical protein
MVTTIFRGITYDVKTATANSQTLTGTFGNDWIEALGGNNQVSTGAGNDVVLAGVNFLFIGNYEPFGGEAIFWGGRSDAGNNVVDSGNDTVILGSTGFATIYNFTSRDRLDVSGLSVDIIQNGTDTLINSTDGTELSILKGYTGNIAFI